MRAGLVLVLGGARSGKSRFAEGLVAESGLAPVYIATAEAGDSEMAERIAHHRGRRGESWRTVEAPLALEAAIESEAGEDRAVLVDCLTLWLSNLILVGGDPEEHVGGSSRTPATNPAGADAEARERALCEAARRQPGLLVFVSNEVGLGLVPNTPLGRRFRDAQGRLNQAIAAIADRVVFVAAGLPLDLKGAP